MPVSYSRPAREPRARRGGTAAITTTSGPTAAAPSATTTRTTAATRSTGKTAATLSEARAGKHPPLLTYTKADGNSHTTPRSPGTPRTINFDAAFNTTGNGYLTIYGWMSNPPVEYYIIESFGTYDPTAYVRNYGTYDADGSTYKLGHTVRYGQIPMEGAETLDRIWAVRQSERTSGSVDVGAHFEAWKAKGLRLGATHAYQIVGTEGYQSTGLAEVTVS